MKFFERMIEMQRVKDKRADDLRYAREMQDFFQVAIYGGEMYLICGGNAIEKIDKAASVGEVLEKVSRMVQASASFRDASKIDKKGLIFYLCGASNRNTLTE